MVHQVAANGLVQSHLEGDFELGADPVGRADQDGRFEALQIEPKQGAETPDSAQNIAVEGLLRQELDAFLGPVAGGDVDAGIGVGYGMGLQFVRHDKSFPPAKFPRGGWAESTILAGDGSAGLCMAVEKK